MKNANGMGSVYKQPGKRRKPWVVRKTVRWEIDEKTGRSKQIYKNIGYYATKQDALAALINYNQNPYDVDSHKLTFSDVKVYTHRTIQELAKEIEKINY